MQNNNLLNYVEAYNTYLKAIEREVKNWEDDLLAKELLAFDKIFTDKQLNDTYLIADDEIEHILITEAANRFISLALSKGSE